MQQNCIANMFAQGPAVGCDVQSATCLCATPDWGYGVADCSSESCPADTDLGQVSSYVNQYCGNVNDGKPASHPIVPIDANI